MTTDKKINVIIITSFILALIFLFFAVLPLFGDIKNNSGELLAQKKISADKDAQKKNLEQFKAFFGLFGENFQKLENLFIDPEMPVEFIQFLENNAAKNNLRLSVFSSPSISSSGEEWPFLSLEVIADGSFPDFMRFLERIENSPYLIKIQSLNILADKANFGKTSADFSIKVFVKPR